MDQKSDPTKLTKAEKTENDLHGFYTELKDYFGLNIFDLSEKDQNILFTEKNKIPTDLLSMRLSIESKIRMLEKQFEKDTEDQELEKQIAALMVQDKTLDNLSKLRNA